jgi:hypothetical protein
MAKAGLQSMLSPALSALGGDDGDAMLSLLSPAAAVATGKGSGLLKMLSPALSVLLGGNEGASKVPGAISEAGALPAAPEEMGEDIVVTGDAWKPRKQTILGALADGYLQSQGMAPAFAQNRQLRNVTEAMEGFPGAPEKALRRLSKIPGMQKEAWGMYNQHEDNSRADQLLGRQLRDSDLRHEDYVHDSARRMLNGATPETYPQIIGIVKKIAERRGVSLEHLPDQWDEAAIRSYILGDVPVDNQLDNSRDAAYKIDEAEAGRNNRAVYNADRADQRTEMIQNRIDARQAKPGNTGGSTAGGLLDVTTPMGKGKMSPDKKRMIVNGVRFELSSDGKQYVRAK